MPNEQILMGFAVAALCAAGLWKDRWFLANTKKGRRLAAWLGETKALWVLRGLFGVGILFGLLLAGDVIRPVHW